jgi:hypothetical protein
VRPAGGDDDPYLISFRGFDNSVYYMTDLQQYVQLLNYSGCGNTVNANNPVVTKLIIDSLRWWVWSPLLAGGSHHQQVPSPASFSANMGAISRHAEEEGMFHGTNTQCKCTMREDKTIACKSLSC